MKVGELISQLEEFDKDREVYTIGVGGDWVRVNGAEKVPHEKLSLEPYAEEDGVGLR